MSPEGMVHALEEAHRLLTPGGVLVDIHPFVEPSHLEVHRRGRRSFSQPWEDCPPEGYHQADRALSWAVRSGLFIRERRASFEYLVYADSVSGLQAYLAEQSGFQGEGGDEAEAARQVALFARLADAHALAGEGAEVASRDRAHITRLVVVK